MKKRISLILAAIMILAVMVPAIPVVAVSNTFNASDANPTISTAADYIAFFKAAFVDKTSDFKGKTITLLEDITLNDTSVANWYAQPDAVKLVGTNDSWIWFLGNFDGGNHTLKGAIVEGTFRNDNVTGLFPYVGDGASIKNLKVDGFYVCSNNTTEDVGSDRVGAGGLIGIAKKNVTVDNISLKNGIVTCVENGKGALGALLGTYTADKYYAGIPNQYLTLTNITVDKTVSVIAPENSNVYTGGFMGHVKTNLTDGIYINLTGSKICPNGSLGAERTLQPFGNFYFNSNGGYIWYFVVDGNTANVRVDTPNTYTEKFNTAIINTGRYGVEDLISGNTFNANDENPTISTAADYIAFFKAVYVDNNSFNGKVVTLLEDITVNDVTASDWYAQSGVVKMANADDDGWSWFEGTFDGNGKTIKGVIVDKKFRNDAVVGIFPHARNATIKNLTIDGFYVSGNGAKAVGGLIGRVGNGVTVQNVTLKNGSVNASNSNTENNQRGVGALIGYVYFDTDATQTVVATDCVVDGSVLVTCDDTNWAGGIIGAIQLQNKNHATINFKGSNFSTMSNDLLAVGYYNQNANGGYQLKLTNDGTSNKWAGSGTGDKTAWVNETIDTFGIYTPPTVWFAGIQTRSSDDAVRFVGLIKIPADLNDVSALGFEVTVGDKTVDMNCTKVYTSIIENGQAKAAPDGYYYFTFAITGVTVGTTFTVKSCATVNGTDYTTASSTYTYAA